MITSDQAKAWVDQLFAAVESHVGWAAFKAALVDVQALVDANWPAIWNSLPSGATLRNVVDGLFAKIKTLPNLPFGLTFLIDMVQKAVDSYLTQNPHVLQPL